MKTWEGKPLVSGYEYSQAPSFVKIQPIKGRPRYKLADTHAPLNFSISMDLTASEFNLWQTYWASVADYGASPFPMRLLSDILYSYTDVEGPYMVQATGPWSAQTAPHNRWLVKLPIEVTITPGLAPTECGDIFGGPLENLSNFDIYGGPITDLSEDIIAPCEEVYDYV